jgi:hypothetical protein
MSDATRLAGGCLCGAIRYAIDGPVVGAGICHCRSCRRSAGAESVAWLTVATGHFHLDRGAPVEHASSPGVARGFCGSCGTTLTYARAGTGSLDVTLASLDDPERVPPTAEWWLADRLSWNPVNPELEHFAGAGNG